MSNFQEYELDEIKNYIQNLLPIKRKINFLHIHHTAEPNKNNYKGRQTIVDIFNYHTKVRGWGDIGYHYIISPSGTIWACRDLKRDPVSIANYNYAALALALIGNFETELLEKAQRQTMIELTSFLLKTFRLEIPGAIIFHNEKAPTACPGKNITKKDFLLWLEYPKILQLLAQSIEVRKGERAYQGYLIDNKSYVEIRKLIEDMNGQVLWDQGKVTIIDKVD